MPPAKTNSIRFYRKHESKSASQECDKWWMRLKVAQECTPNMSLGKMCYLHTCTNNCESSFSRSASVNSLPILLFGGLFVWPIHCECLAFHLLIWMTPQSGYFGDLNQFLTEKHFWCCLQQNKKASFFGLFLETFCSEIQNWCLVHDIFCWT